MGATVQKSFLFEQSVAEHLDEVAYFMRTSIDSALRELIEERYKEIEKQKKLKAFEALVESVKKSGGNPFMEQFAPDDAKIFQKIKEIMADEI